MFCTRVAYDHCVSVAFAVVKLFILSHEIKRTFGDQSNTTMCINKTETDDTEKRIFCQDKKSRFKQGKDLNC